MSTQDIEIEIYEQMQPFFNKKGYELKKSLKQYRKETEAGFQNFIFSLSKSKEDYCLEVNFGTRIEAIEYIAQQFLDTLPAFQQETNTLIISVGKFNDNKYFRYKITNREDLKATCAQIREFILHSGLPFVERYHTLRSIDGLFNKKPLKPNKYLYNQSHRYFKGLIAAKLNHNPSFLALSDTYLQQLEMLKVPETLLISYHSLVNYLSYYSVN